MSCFRVLLLWALILAIPFQGYAAASMAFCETAQSDTTAAVQVDSHHHPHAAASDSSPFKEWTMKTRRTATATQAVRTNAGLAKRATQWP